MINDRVTSRSYTEISSTRNRVQEEVNHPLDMEKRKMESDAASSTILPRRRSLWVGQVFPPADVPLPSPHGALQRSPHELTELPSLGRSLYDFIAIMPGATSSND